MSKIQERIKKLQLKQLKISYINYLIDLIKSDDKCYDFLGIKDEIVSQVEIFLNSIADSIENEDEIKSTISTESKVVENRPYQKETISPVTPVSNTVMSVAEKMNFAMNNRHLGGKNVRVMTDKGQQIEGKVVGLDAPHVVVETTHGPVINVPIDKIEMMP